MVSTDGKYRIGAVSRMTGISTHALRVWERRYQAVEPVRTPGGDRLFSDRDIERLRSIKRLIERGHPVSQVARLGDDELFALIGDKPAEPALGEDGRALRREFMAALRELDVRRADSMLTRAATLQPTATFLSQVVAPLLQEIGDAWAAGELRIAHEHAASAILRNLIGTMTRLEPPVADAPTVVATTLAGELHEFGVLLATLTAAANRWNMIYLGPNLPADEIVHAVNAGSAELLFLSFVDRDRVDDAEVVRLAERLPPAVGVVLGGSAAREVEPLWAGRHTVFTTTSLSELEEWMDRYEQARSALT